MKITIRDIHSNVAVRGKGFPQHVTIRSREEVSVGKNQMGILIGKKTHHDKGVFFQGGLINPGWKGYLTIELVIFGEIDIKEGEEVAHAIIFTEGEYD